MIIRYAAIGLAIVGVSASALGADATAGKRVFRTQCAICHSAQPGDDGGGQGPDLNGVFGRKAASASFGYTEALRTSGLTWDAATLDRFLKAPTTLVPGTAMVIALPTDSDRENVIAYFQAVKDGTFQEAAVAKPVFRPPPAAENQGSVKTDADWKKDAPGRMHRIDLAAMPPPFDTPSARNFPHLIPRPADAKLSVPAGFKVDVFARDVEAPRAMRLAPNGDIFLTETNGGRVKVMRPSADGSKAETVTVFAQGLTQPFGLQFYPVDNPKWLYVAENNRVVRYAYKVGDSKASGIPEVVVPELTPTAGGGHFTRDIAFSPDGKRMFISAGSTSNVAENMSKKTPEQIKAWEAEHGLGAAWDKETNRADVLVFEVGSDKPGKIFASGLRNCVGLTIQPGNGKLWCTVNERDALGDDLVPDYSTTVQEGGYYGWPWYYMGNHEDPRLKGDRPDLAGKAIVPDVPYQAHSAALNLAFYTATSGASVFPKDYLGDGFAVFHGSWNRAFRTGHKVVRIIMKDGVPTGEYQDFLVGFIADDGDAWGRPVGAVVAKDGSLLISDDGGNLVYRISTTQ
jgi:glucose/arabinose dehydrogenase/cytochrome c2